MGAILTFVARLLLILLFFPFSALDKALNFRAAVGQAREAMPSRMVAGLLVVAGFLVEVFMSLGVLTGVADRACALVLAFYCCVTALLWKRFWAAPDFRLVGPSRGREIFWDFLKNLAVAGGFLLVTLGPAGEGFHAFLAAPLSSSHPYASIRSHGP